MILRTRNVALSSVSILVMIAGLGSNRDFIAKAARFLSPLGSYAETETMTRLSFHYEKGEPLNALRDGEFRVHQMPLASKKGTVFIYATFEMTTTNPVAYLNGHPTGLQFVTLGQTTAGKFIPAIRFGIQQGEQMSGMQAQLVPWIFDGRVNYYGAYARPSTPYDFKIKLDTTKARASVFALGRGDDDWFMLVEDAPLMFPVAEINEIRVEQYPDSRGIPELVVHSSPWPKGGRDQGESSVQKKQNGPCE